VHYLVMQYVEGRDLSSIVHKHGPLTPVQALELALQIGKGLEHAHQQGIVHRDIKPANVLLDVHGAVKILDMGLARFETPLAPSASTAPDADATELTMSGSVIGTIDYMSPEQAMDAKTSDHRSDIYSLGCTLHFLLTGRPVYGGDNLLQRLLAHREAPLPSLTNVPAEVNATFRRMIAKKAEDRYQQMAEVMRDIEHSLQAARAWAKARPAVETVAAQDRSSDAPPPAAINGLEDTIVYTEGPIVASHLRQLLGADFSVDVAKISLAQMNISDDDLAELAGIPNLEALDLEGTPITDAGLVHLSRLSHLQRLDLSGTSVTDAGLALLTSIGGLRRLFLAETAITDAGMPHLAHFTHLNRLSLSGTKMSDAGLIHLAKLRQLASLDLSYTRVSDKSLNYLRHLSALEEIDLSGTRFSSAGVRALVRLLPKTQIML
ncbi:MAG: protein kinase domain-containing protein, partial [Pirellulales bacterium]